MRIVRAVPGPPAVVEADGDELHAFLADHYRLEGSAWLRLNLITALGGEITGPSGGSDDLADGIDRPLLRVLRLSGDAVLVGASSVRAGGYTLPRNGAPLAVVTTTGDLAGHALPERIEPGRLLVLCPPPAAARVVELLGDRATVVPLDGDPLADPALILRALAARGLGRIVCEGGGALASRLVAAGLADEFDHSIAPVLTSPGAPLTSGDVPLTTARLAGLLVDPTDRLYCRWSLPRPRRILDPGAEIGF